MAALRSLAFVVLLAVVSLVGPERTSRSDRDVALAREVPVQLLPLAGDLARADAEISGLAWHGDTLVMLPQYPDRFAPRGSDTAAGIGSLLVLSRASVEAAIAGARTPLTPRRVPMVTSGIEESIDGFEGYEAIAFDGDRVFVTVEADTAGATHGFVLAGHATHGASGELTSIELESATRAELDVQCDVDNLAYEALTVVGGDVVALHEANGIANPRARANVFTTGLGRRPALDVSAVEYRVTDATAADRNGRFWVTNYHYDGDCWATGSCPLTSRFGVGRSHRGRNTLERLVELEIVGGRVQATDTAPIYIELDAGDGRNWEGVVRLGERGFLVATDEHPGTLLGFVAR